MIRNSAQLHQNGNYSSPRQTKRISGEKVSSPHQSNRKRHQKRVHADNNIPVITQNRNSMIQNPNHASAGTDLSFSKSIHQNWRFLVIAITTIFLLTTSIKTTGTYHMSDSTLHPNGHMEGKSAFSIATSFEASDSPNQDLSPGENVRLSKSLQMLADLDDLPLKDSDVPFFFHVPRSGGSTVKDILGSCIGFVQASDVGARHGHKHDKTLEVMQEKDGSQFVNVDTTTAEGIHRAKKLGLVQSGLADVLVTQHLHPAATMFNENQKGRYVISTI